MIFIATVCHAENVIDARFVSSSEEATALASTLDARRTSAGLLAEDTKQAAERKPFRESPYALQQLGVGCAAWFVHSKGVIK